MTPMSTFYETIKIVSIKDLITYRMREEGLIEETETISLLTKFGKFKAIGFRDRVLNGEYVVLVKGDIGDRENMPVRVHSGCVFHLIRCDCGG